MSADPASLVNLNDIIVPPAPSWWPPAAGWYLLAGVTLVLASWLAYRGWKRYRNNRYRREALSELAQIEAGPEEEVAARLPSLLKRTALQVYPRAQIASLSGEAWIAFLNRQCAADPFAGKAGQLLGGLAYRSGSSPRDELQPLFAGVRTWIEQHEADAC